MPTPQMTTLGMKVCRKCGVEKPMDDFYNDARKDGKASSDGKKPWCKPCHSAATAADGRRNPKRRAEASRRYRSSHPEYKQKNNNEPDREKRRAWWTLNEAVRSGRIVKPALCSDCDRPGVLHGHHEDYSRALDVVWLCATCHKNLHLSRNEK